MPAKRIKPIPVPANLVEAVHATAAAYKLGPEHTAAYALAVSLAKSLDEMDAGTRSRMAGQTAGALLRTLEAMTDHAGLVSTSTSTGRSTLSGRWNAIGA